MTKNLFLFSLFWHLGFAQPYVTCKFDGQLGNQLFEIATVVSYALDHGYRPVFPTLKEAEFGSINQKYVLHRVACDSESESYAHYYEQFERKRGIYSPIPQVEGNLCLHGFFQNVRYFAHHSEEIRALFAPSDEMRMQIFKKYGRLLVQPNVALHLRTFIADGKNSPNANFAGCGWEYFIRAMELFPRDVCFLVFSDEMAWVKENFPTTNRKIVFVEGNHYYFDFYLMSLCEHQIVSPNSTFSWWAAFLNKNPEKKVIIPAMWSKRGETDISPPEWIKI